MALLFGVGVLGAIIIVPIVALVSALRAGKRTLEARRNLDLARLRIEKVEQRLAGLEESLRRMESLAANFDSAARASVPQQQLVADTTSAAARAPEASEDRPKVSGVAGEPDGCVPLRPEERVTRAETASAPEAPNTPTGPTAEEESIAKSRTAKEQPCHEDLGAEAATSKTEDETALHNRPPPQFNLEGLIGVRLFAWIGGGALFLGAALFLHYSIQQNLISPPVRVALGLMTGALLLVGGDRPRLKGMMASQAIMGAGVGTLYASLYASRSLYHLIPTPGAFAGMVLVTATAGALATRRRAYLLAVLGLMGGMATPFLLSTGEDRPWSLFGYVVLLDLAIAWVSRKREWPTLALLGFCASLLVFIAWSSEYLYSNRAPYALGAIALVAALFASLIHFKQASGGDTDSTLRATAQFAIATPLLVALVLVCHPKIDVDPTFLTVYLVVITFGSTLVAHTLDTRNIPVAAALMGAFTQVLRTGHDLFPAHTVSTLASFSMLPLAHAGIALWKRQTSFARLHLCALGVVLASPIAIAPLAGSFHSGNARFSVIGVYTALHGLGLLVLAWRYADPRFFVLAQIVAWVVEASLRNTGGASITGSWSIWLAMSGIVFWSMPLFVSSLKREPLALGAAALALPSQYTLLYGFARNDWESGPLGLLSVMGGLLMIVGIRRIRMLPLERESNRAALMALHGALCLAFLTAALPILLEKQWLTVALGLEVAALAWLRRRIAHEGLVLAAAILGVVALIRLVFNPWLWEYQSRSGLPALNFYLYTFGLVAASFIGAARLLQGNRFADEFKMSMLLNWAAIALLFVLVNVEVADYFSTGSSLVFRFSGGGLAQDTAYSLSWGCFALALMVLGIVRRTTSLRLGALLFLSLTVAKVFLHDLWQLGALYRVGSVVGLAVALLAVSYLVQRFIFRGGKA